MLFLKIVDIFGLILVSCAFLLFLGSCNLCGVTLLVFFRHLCVGFLCSSVKLFHVAPNFFPTSHKVINGFSTTAFRRLSMLKYIKAVKGFFGPVCSFLDFSVSYMLLCKRPMLVGFWSIP